MRRALTLARRGQGRVEPNPMVGCVLAHGPRVIAEGYHRAFGRDHAEVDALRRTTESPRGATAYVTLEPCCHYGKTPPCTVALIHAGISRVVAAMRDPDERARGNGIRSLRRAGVAVDVGLCEREAADLNRPYLTRITRKRPYVILKWAQSLDGKIATRTGESRWISSPASRYLVHKLRARVDAIVVGIGTVLADDPLLTARNVAVRRVATRVVLDTRLRLPERCRLVRTAKAVPTIVLTSKAAVAAGESRVARLERRGVEVVPCTVRSSAIDLTTAMRILARRQFTNVLVEGGGKVLSAFLDSRLADEALVLVSPKLIGGTSAPMAYGGAGRMRISDTNCSVVEIRRSGEDQLYHIVL